MTTNHIDQLRVWWSEAEHAPFREGDMLISRREGQPVTYEVYPAGCDHNAPTGNVRILARAPKPKPAWHGAVAVIGHTAGDKERRAMVKCGETRIGRRPLETSWDDSAHGAVL